MSVSSSTATTAASLPAVVSSSSSAPVVSTPSDTRIASVVYANLPITPEGASSLTTDSVSSRLRVITPRSYWAGGIIKKIYYCFIYYFVLPRDQKEVMAILYSHIRQARRHGENVNCESIAYVLQSDTSKAALVELFKTRKHMLEYAFGSKENAFVALVDIAFFTSSNEGDNLFHEMIRQLIGDDELASNKSTIFMSFGANDRENRALIQDQLANCILVAKNHPCIGHLTERAASEENCTRLINDYVGRVLNDSIQSNINRENLNEDLLARFNQIIETIASVSLALNHRDTNTSTLYVTT